MQTQSLLYGLIGFFIGGFIVSVAATTFDKPANTTMHNESESAVSSMSMEDMSMQLEGKTGDEFDKAFIEYMIEHHEGAVDMAQLAANKAKHDEIRRLSAEIITAQEREIADMMQWQKDWGYESNPDDDHGRSMH